MNALALAGLIVAQPQTDFVVQPVYLVPSDLPIAKENVTAINRIMQDINTWYEGRVGAKFKLNPVRQVKARKDWVTMRLGENPKPEDVADESFSPNWYSSVVDEVNPLPKQITVIFSTGGGKYTMGKQTDCYSGTVVVGDWVMEPISGVRVSTLPKPPADAWQIKGSVPTGIVANRMAQAFGLLKPERYEGSTILTGFQSFPNVGLLAHEAFILRNSPYFGYAPGDKDAPVLDVEMDDQGFWGESIVIKAQGLRDGDQIELNTIGPYQYITKNLRSPVSMFVPFTYATPERGRMTVPRDVGPGFLRLYRGALRSNIVPINVYPKRLPTQ